MSPAPLGNDRPPAPETESIYLNGVEEEQDNSADTADKQSDTDEDMPDSQPPATTTDIRNERIAANERLALLRNIMIPSTNLPTSFRIDNREMARYSIPEAEIWEPYGTNQAMRRLAENRRPSASAAYTEIVSPASMEGDKAEEQEMDEEEEWCEEESPSYLGCDPTSLRLIPAAPSPFLRPGSRFVGTQQSERQVYDVQVEIKHVDLRESFLCGYLRIQGLTEDHPTLTTYFEGEIIGSKYGFNTKHKSWGANDRIDMSHWAKFAAFRPFAKQAKKGTFTIKDYLQKENIFMRWKEHFLVPDHRVRTIHGASFEGFYYICFNQVEGVVHGIYFHSKSEKFQQLELKHVEDRGCMSAVEFR
ncbi:hypothetical protein SBRCBS47491_007763 [Sporothrix bragantina]|uniref:Vesicle-mediated transport protein n=1 Tax=Sporothrix bragantina TaxID=671064 RepID=A0ABP0CFU0_9PEZI